MDDKSTKTPIFPSLVEAIEDDIQLCQKMRNLIKRHKDVGDSQQRRVLGMIMTSLHVARKPTLFRGGGESQRDSSRMLKYFSISTVSRGCT
nr:hypothetical protein [Candidatus Njordarchaeum guaymaensis]